MFRFVLCAVNFSSGVFHSFPFLSFLRIAGILFYLHSRETINSIRFNIGITDWQRVIERCARLMLITTVFIFNYDLIRGKIGIDLAKSGREFLAAKVTSSAYIIRIPLIILGLNKFFLFIASTVLSKFHVNINRIFESAEKRN